MEREGSGGVSRLVEWGWRFLAGSILGIALIRRDRGGAPTNGVKNRHAESSPQVRDDPAEAWRRAAGQALAFVRDNPWAAPTLIGAVAVFTYGLSLRYYDEVFNDAGVPGATGSMDKGQILSRALVLAILFLPGTFVAFPAFVASRTAWRKGAYRLLPTLLILVPLPIGLVLASEGVPSATWLFLPILSLLPAYVLGAAAGQYQRIKGWIRGKSKVPDRKGERVRTEDTSVRIALGFLVALVAAVLTVSIVETAAQHDLEAIREGGNQQILTATFVPLDLRLTAIAWIDPTLRPAYESLFECSVLLVGHRNGRTLLVDATRTRDRPVRLLDVNSSAIALREPNDERARATCLS